VRIDVPRTIADGLQATEPGELTFEVNRNRVDEVVTVTDEEIVATMRFLFERLKVVVEPSGASALAALVAGRVVLDGARWAVRARGGYPLHPGQRVRVVGRCGLYLLVEAEVGTPRLAA
jgi:threonine dehydratase